MRVIAGAARGRRLTAPAGRDTRPTSDRAREGLFSTLEALRGPLAGARVLDLYAGSGAVGLEALSRGAAHVLLVESHGRAVTAIRSNVSVVGLPGAAVRAERVARVLAGRPDERYDVVFADPPYAEPVVEVLEALDGWLAPGGVVVVERAARDDGLAWPSFIEPLRDRRYGEGVLWYGRRAATEGAT
ncbi:MAG TPA: 16S rRNA (guanine(966)-N(2))-methyltransferase RsmD [Mycobacteriales bacterium]|nr:16S rRNA (guanine(966)-N(2))-methyltransferase RsmD [Mycobacteriales bacterium]